ncbi:MAG: flagellin [Acinetobacter sp.]|nr:flagellin [Acinetobacter sp.]
MINLNTNLGAMIVFSNLKVSTNGLNTAIERMTSGYKINRAGDNAANFSINTKLSTQIGAYSVAEENAMMGLDMLSTASSALDQMSNLASRLRCLAAQAQNGTYGTQSLSAVKSEANALVAEIKSIFGKTEYNGIKLLNSLSEKLIEDEPITQTPPAGIVPNPSYNGFIENPQDYSDAEVAAMTALSGVSSSTRIRDGQYSITTLEEFEQFAEMSRAAKIQGGEFVLGADIDLSSYSAGEGFIPIAAGINSSADFKCEFNGNGHTISNLYINRPDTDNVGLFSFMCDVKNLCLTNVDVIGGIYTGALMGYTFSNSQVSNCYIASGSVKGTTCVGGLGGRFSGINGILNCYSDAEVLGETKAGGLLGETYLPNGSVINSFSHGNVTASSDYAGGLIGYTERVSLENCYAEGNITGKRFVGGGVGKAMELIAVNCFAKGKVTGTSSVGGFAGSAGGSSSGNIIENCYAYGEVIGEESVGGFAGLTSGSTNGNGLILKACHALGNVTATQQVGGLVGFFSFHNSVYNCSATGTVKGNSCVGGLIGDGYAMKEIKNCYSTGDVIAKGNFVGGIIGRTSNSNDTDITGCYSTGNISGVERVGGVMGFCDTILSLSDCYSTGNISGQKDVGGVVGYLFWMRGPMTGCSSQGRVSGDTNIGGLVGQISSFLDLSIDNCISSAEVSGNNSAGSFIGRIEELKTISVTNCKTAALDLDTIGSTSSSISNEVLQNMLNGIEVVEVERVDPSKIKITLQVGINSDANSKLTFNTSFSAEVIDALLDIDILNTSALEVLDFFINEVNQKQVEYGAVENRLQSALEQISVSYDNLVSTQSTIRDADIAEESSSYIRNQILQQAASTLMATANQTPAIALQLL